MLLQMYKSMLTSESKWFIADISDYVPNYAWQAETHKTDSTTANIVTAHWVVWTSALGGWEGWHSEGIHNETS